MPKSSRQRIAGAVSRLPGAQRFGHAVPVVVLLAGGGGAVLVGTTVDFHRVPITRRMQLAIFDEYIVNTMAKRVWRSGSRAATRALTRAQTYRELMQKEGMEQRLLPPEHEDTVLVAHIVHRLLAVAGEEMEGRRFEWRVHVVDSPKSVNAFVLADGNIFVFTGLLHVVRRDVDALAFILAHEMAHTLARHSAEKSFLAALVAIGDLATSALVALFFDFSLQHALHLFKLDSIRSEFASTLINSPYSQRLETEADFIGLILASRACFAPRAAAEVWRRFAEHEALSDEERAEDMRGERQWQQRHWPTHGPAHAPARAQPATDPQAAESAEANAQGPCQAGEFPAAAREPSLLVRILSTHPSHQRRHDKILLWQEMAAREQEGKRCETMQAAWWKAVLQRSSGPPPSAHGLGHGSDGGKSAPAPEPDT